MFLSEATPSGFFFLAPWLVFAPLIGLLINMIFGHRLSEKWIGTVASLASGAAFVVRLPIGASGDTDDERDAIASRSQFPD